MYPRNAASPERVAVGPVVLIADGTVQTSAVSITVVPQGGSSAAGAGTTTYEQGVVFYTPTQEETNHTSFIVTAYKASCLPVSATVITTASVTPGRTRLESVTHTGATVPTVSDVTNLHASAATVTNQNTLLGRLIGTIVAGTHNPQSGDTFAQLPTNFSDQVISAAGAVDAMVQGFINVLITETVAGRISDNFDTLFDNANATSTLTLDMIALASVVTEARLSELDAANIPANIDAILLDTGTDGVQIDAATANKIADHVLRRAWATAAASSDGDAKSFRSLLGATAKLVNKVSIAGSTLIVTEADDTTSIGTQTLTTDSAADPITGADTD